MVDVGIWIRDHARRREAGLWDCCTMPAQWAVDNGWPDPMAHWRGRYDCEDAASAIVAEAGGLAALFADGAVRAGLALREGDPVAGDIGVIRIAEHEAGGLFTGKRWALVADRGWVITSVDPTLISAAWCIHG